ncbi:MAG: hypothetical protein IJY80_04480, partial [Opitutales bacterium]|nr:hypothetical protein [Opitutales bacterium]
VLSQIAKKAGIKIVKESAEAIKRSAGKADGGRFKKRVPRSSPMEEAAMEMLHRERGVFPVDYHHGRDDRVYFFETRGASKVYDYRPLFSIAVLGNEDMLNELTIGIEDGTISTTKGLRDVVSSLRVQEGGSPVSYSRVKEWKRLARYEPTDNSDIRRDGEASRKGADYQNDSVHGEQSGIKPLEYQGTIYGYYDPAKKELHLNEEVVDLDTPIHEWTHVWWAWLKGEDPRMIERIVELMKQTKEFKTLKGQWLRDKDSVYHGMTDEGIAEEVFARFVGARGEDILVREGVGTWARIRRCVLDFFKKVFRTLGLAVSVFDGEDGSTPKAVTKLLRSTAATRQVVNLIDTWITDIEGEE